MHKVIFTLTFAVERRLMILNFVENILCLLDFDEMDVICVAVANLT